MTASTSTTRPATGRLHHYAGLNFGEFLRAYDGAALPSNAIAKNVLREKGVPAERVDGVLDLIVETAKALGFIREWSGKRYVDLSAGDTTSASTSESNGEEAAPMAARPAPAIPQGLPVHESGSTPAVTLSSGVNINIEIHIAADASTQTIEDIFRNMRRYVLKPDGEPENAK